MNSDLLKKLISINPNKELYSDYLYNIEKGMDTNIASQLFIKKINIICKNNLILFYLSLITFFMLEKKYGIVDSIIQVKIDKLRIDRITINLIKEYLHEAGMNDTNWITKTLQNEYVNEQANIKRIPLTNKNWKLWDVYYIEIDENINNSSIFKNKVLYIQRCGTYDFGVSRPIAYFKIGDKENIPTSKEEYDELEYIQVDSDFYDERLLPFDSNLSLEEHIKEKEKIHFPTNEFGYLPVFRLAVYKCGRNTPSELKFLGNYPDPVLPNKEYIHNGGRETMFHEWKDDLLVRVTQNYLYHNLRKSPIYAPGYKREFTVSDLVESIRLVDKDHIIK